MKVRGIRKKLFAIFVVALAIAIGVGAIYIHYSDALGIALFDSLGTVDIFSVTYPSVEPTAVDLNVTLSLENPTDFPITVERVALYFLVDNKEIAWVDVTLEQPLRPNETHYFSLIQPVRDPPILSSLRNPTYALKIDQGRVTGSAGFLFVETRRSKRFTLSRTVAGIP